MSGPRAKAERVAEIRAEEALFESRGFSRVKVTRAGQAQVLEIPIRSSGVWELMEELSAQAPRPPFRAEWIAADSDLGRQLGLDRDRPVMLFDTTDPDYIDRLGAHHREVLWRVLTRAVDLPFVDREGRELNDPRERRELLRASGLTEHQAEKIFRDIQRLSKLDEEIEDFICAGS